MSLLFFDASALVKRYVTETGSPWVAALVDPSAGYTVVIAAITRVETAAALASKYRSGVLTLAERDSLVDLLLQHCDTDYQIIPVDAMIFSNAVTLTQLYRLRGYDAVQLATALAANRAFIASGLNPLTLIAADNDVLMAARAEGIVAENPNVHP